MLDSIAKVRTRIAWKEEAMFCRAVLPKPKRGTKEGQSYAQAKNALDRWEQGDRKSLWEELPAIKAKSKKKGRWMYEYPRPFTKG